MNSPLQATRLGFEPGLQLLMIVSALVHIMAIVLITDPFGAGEKGEDSYFVNLVPPVKLNQTKKSVLADKPIIKEKIAVQVKPEKKKEKEKSAVQVKPEKKKEPIKKKMKSKPADVSIKPIAKQSTKKSIKPRKQSSASIVPLAKSRSFSEKKYSIKRQMPVNKESYRSDTLAMDRTGRGSAFTSKNDIALQGKSIAGKKIAETSEYASIAKGVREQSFASITDTQNGQHMIKRTGKVAETDIVPLEKASRDSLFSSSGQIKNIDENQYVISRSEQAVKMDTVPEHPEKRNVNYPATNFSSPSGKETATDNDGIPAISRPAVPAGPVLKQSIPAEKKQLLKETILDGEGREDRDASPGLSIQAVPLEDLHACSNALDERTLKKKILRIINDRKTCYSQDIGEYVFMGTARFASFDMKIFPRTGRTLSNRCEELRNALHCLTLN